MPKGWFIYKLYQNFGFILIFLFTGFFIPEGLVGKNGAVYGKFGAFCLETQNFPDAINQPNFPECLIKPGQVYKHRTIFQFGSNWNNHEWEKSAWE